MSDNAVSVIKKRLVNPQRRRTLLTMQRVFSYGMRNFTRNAWLTVAATVVMVITLTIVFITGIASSILEETIEAQKAKMDLSLYIKPETTNTVLNQLAGLIRRQPNVTDVSVSTSEAEHDKFIEVNKTNKTVLAGLQAVAESGIKMKLPAVIHIKLEDYGKRDALAKYVEQQALFRLWVDRNSMSARDIEARQNTIERLADIMKYASKGGMIVAAVFVAISVLIIFNTIRMTIFSRRDEIAMMRAIGADNYFIRGPFLVEAELYGVIAGVLTVAAGYLLLLYVLPNMRNYITVDHTGAMFRQWWWLVMFGMMAAGWLIGNISARLAIHRYMKW